ncbi:MAG TPA: NAD(P)H-hydrate dehydratase [Kofleriaceae bacterium]|nr:NAD(P)H-hydrate dehydratase [Kofleriaceae bacterium]
MKPVVTAAEMRALDAATIEEIGLPGVVLMETAGRAVAEAAWRERARGAIAVVCGPGNNGGDGFVCARVLRERGADAIVYLVGAVGSVKGDARTHLDALIRAGGVVHEVVALDEHKDAIARAGVIVDALFGTGLARELDGTARAIVEIINESSAWVVAADLPSGLDADTGRALGACVLADVTVTMGALKVGLASAPGFARAGAIEIAEIGIPRRLIDATAVRAGLVEEADVRALIPKPSAMDHKGRRGHVLVVGGAPGKRGAARLASMAAARAGAGLVTLAAPGDGEIVADDVIMTEALRAPHALATIAPGKDAIACGPGLGRDDAARELVDAALATGLPCVLDADALHAIADRPERVTGAAGPVVLTPHPGEAAALLGLTAAEIEADRLTAARALAARFRAIVVLKGARTIVCDGTLADDFCAINPTGGPALATGGTGDVLTGVIAALIAQGLAPSDAARCGVWVHGAAGDRLGESLGRGATAHDLARSIAHAVRAMLH